MYLHLYENTLKGTKKMKIQAYKETASFEKFASKKNKKGCPTGKRRFADHKQAVAALHGSKRVGQIEVDLYGQTRRAEKRVYMCGRCGGGFHMTSQEARGMVA